MENIDDLVSSLDSQVLRVLGALHFSESFLAWDRELHPLLSEMYWTMVRRTKDDIRAVARDFRREDRFSYLYCRFKDIKDRTGVLRLMLFTVELVRSRESSVSSRINPQELRRMRDEIPTLRNAINSITNKFSTCQDELDAYLDVFGLLEEPVDAIELLLSSLSSTIANAHLVHGKALIGRLVRLWADRRLIAAQAIGLVPESQELQQLKARLADQREDQVSILTSLMGLIEQLREAPPLHFLNHTFAARKISGASWVFRRLDMCCTAMIEDIERLETTLDHFMNVIAPNDEE